MNRQIYIALFMILFSCTVYAQGIDRSITDTVSIQIDLEAMSRKYKKVVKPTFKPVSIPFTYSKNIYDTYAHKGLPIQPEIASYELSHPTTDQLNFLKLGAGNYLSSKLTGLVRGKIAARTHLGVYVDHLASFHGPVDQSSSAVGKNEGSVFINHSTKNKLTLHGNLGFGLDRVHFYGFPTPINEIARDSIQQTFTSFSGGITIHNKLKDQSITYISNTKSNYVKDSRLSDELLINNLTTISFDLDSQVTLLTTIEGSFSSFTSGLGKFNRNYLQVAPSVEYRLNEFTFNAGVSFFYQNDTLNHNKELSLFPQLKANYLYRPLNMNLYASLSGGINRLTYQDVINENQWVDSTLALTNEINKYTFSLGVKGGYKKLDYFVEMSYRRIQNLLFYINNSLSPEQLSAIYETKTSGLFTLKSSLAYPLTKRWKASLNNTFYGYDLPTLGEAYGRPTNQFDFRNTYALSKKLDLSLSLHHISGITYIDLNGKNQTLNPILDLSIAGSYQLKDNWSIWVDVANVFNSSYSYYANYPGKRLNALAGASFYF